MQVEVLNCFAQNNRLFMILKKGAECVCPMHFGVHLAVVFRANRCL